MSHSFAIDIVEEDVQLTLVELCRATRAPEGQIHTWVVEGVLIPEGATPAEWRFHGEALRRARLASTLARELEINPPGVALALDLIDEIDALKSRLQRVR
jgi:chaperone modulatory protein CbpM